MYTTKEIRNALNKEGKNTFLGQIFLTVCSGENHLFRNADYNASYSIDLFTELLVFAHRNYGIDLIKDSFNVGQFQFIYHSYKVENIKPEYKLKRVNQ